MLVGLQGPRVCVTARLDLADCGPAELDHTLLTLLRGGCQSLLAAVFCGPDASHLAEFTPTIEALVAACQRRELLVGEVLIARDGQFWTYRDAIDDAAGRPVSGERSQAAATATYAGLVAHPDRASMIAVLDHDEDEVRAELQGPLREAESLALQALWNGTAERHRRSVKRAIFAAARLADATLALRRDSPQRAQELCRFGIGLTDIAVRDAVWIAVDQGRLDGRALWQELLNRLPAPFDAPPLFLFGWSCWREGNGVLAAEAALRALDSDPGYTAAELLFSAVDRGLDPHRTPRLRLSR